MFKKYGLLLLLSTNFIMCNEKKSSLPASVWLLKLVTILAVLPPIINTPQETFQLGQESTINYINGIKVEYTKQCSPTLITYQKKIIGSKEFTNNLKDSKNPNYHFFDQQGCELLIGDKSKAIPFDLDIILPNLEEKQRKSESLIHIQVDG